MMLSTMLKQWPRIVLGILWASLILATPSTLASKNANSRIFPVNAKPHGLSYSEWSVRHWQWLFSLPVNAHPLFDTADCGAGQSGHVWFLGGTFTLIEPEPGVVLGQATRNCSIPSGTALFLPIVSAECSTIEGNGQTEAELRDCAQLLADLIDSGSLHLEIDGEPATNLQDYRVESSLFTFGPLPANNALGAPAGATSPSVSDGIFIMVKPLSVGDHTIHFTGTANLSSIGGPVFIQDITYDISVIPRGQLEHLD